MPDYSRASGPQLPFFVYGSLLPGEPNDFLWRYVAEAEQPAILPGGALYDLGPYPMLVDSAHQAVRGLAVRVRDNCYHDVLATLDDIEGFDPMQPHEADYRRVPRIIHLLSGRPVVAWVYVGRVEAVAGLNSFGGDWKAYLRGGRM